MNLGATQCPGPTQRRGPTRRAGVGHSGPGHDTEPLPTESSNSCTKKLEPLLKHTLADQIKNGARIISQAHTHTLSGALLKHAHCCRIRSECCLLPSAVPRTTTEVILTNAKEMTSSCACSTALRPAGSDRGPSAPRAVRHPLQRAARARRPQRRRRFDHGTAETPSRVQLTDRLELGAADGAFCSEPRAIQPEPRATHPARRVPCFLMRGPQTLLFEE